MYTGSNTSASTTKATNKPAILTTDIIRKIEFAFRFPFGIARSLRARNFIRITPFLYRFIQVLDKQGAVRTVIQDFGAVFRNTRRGSKGAQGKPKKKDANTTRSHESVPKPLNLPLSYLQI
jgi:hypothetical protein